MKKILITILIITIIFLVISVLGYLDILVSQKYELDTYFVLHSDSQIKNKLIELIRIQEKSIQLEYRRIHHLISIFFSSLLIIILLIGFDKSEKSK